MRFTQRIKWRTSFATSSLAFSSTSSSKGNGASHVIVTNTTAVGTSSTHLQEIRFCGEKGINDAGNQCRPRNGALATSPSLLVSGSRFAVAASKDTLGPKSALSFLWGTANNVPINIDGGTAPTAFVGSRQDDTFIGGSGAQIYIGGAGNDRYRFANAVSGSGAKVYEEKSWGAEDRLDFRDVADDGTFSFGAEGSDSTLNATIGAQRVAGCQSLDAGADCLGSSNDF